ALAEKTGFPCSAHQAAARFGLMSRLPTARTAVSGVVFASTSECGARPDRATHLPGFGDDRNRGKPNAVRAEARAAERGRANPGITAAAPGIIDTGDIGATLYPLRGDNFHAREICFPGATRNRAGVERDETRHRVLSGLARPSALAPFRIRNYRFQWPADLLTSCAFEMETLILGWYVLVETRSVLLLTLFG